MADPLLAVIGSVQTSRSDEIGLKNLAGAEAAAENVGRALARQRCRLVAYSDTELSVEHLVVRGYVAECTSNPALKDFAGESGRIEIPYSTSDRRPEFPEQKAALDSFFLYRPDKNPSWASSFYRSLGRVDGVILIGGSHSTYIAGTVAMTHGKPVAAISTFGGTAEGLWRELSPQPGVLEQGEIDLMTSSKWNQQAADALIKNILEQRERSAKKQKFHSSKEKTHTTNQVFIAVPFLIAALATVPFTWDNPDLARTVLLSILLLSPLLAGVSGATARKAFEAIGGPPAHDPPSIGPTAGLGAIAGGVAGAMFIVAQLVAMSPEIGQTVWSKQAGRLVPFAVLIGFVAGLTLDAVFRRLTGVNVITDDMLKTLTERAPPRAGS